MFERTGLVTIHGNPLTLVGEAVKVGAPAPMSSCWITTSSRCGCQATGARPW